MEIIISNSSDKPIYEQICMQVKNLIMNGTLSAGEALPSMRALAKDLHISVITVQRAYEDLTRDGFIETVSGKGSFVAAQNMEFIQEEQLRIAEELLQKAAASFIIPLLWTGICLPLTYWFGFRSAQTLGLFVVIPMLYFVKYFEVYHFNDRKYDWL